MTVFHKGDEAVNGKAYRVLLLAVILCVAGGIFLKKNYAEDEHLTEAVSEQIETGKVETGKDAETEKDTETGEETETQEKKDYKKILNYFFPDLEIENLSDMK